MENGRPHISQQTKFLYANKHTRTHDDEDEDQGKEIPKKIKYILYV